MEIPILTTQEGLTIFDILGIMYCDNCGTRCENTEEWRLKHKEECK